MENTGARPKELSRMLDPEELRLERLHRLKGSKSALKGSLNRAQRKIEELFLDYSKYETVLKWKESWDNTFIKYAETVKSYGSNLAPTQGEEIDAARAEFDSILANKNEFEQYYDEWLASAREQLGSVDVNPALQVNTSLKRPVETSKEATGVVQADNAEKRTSALGSIASTRVSSSAASQRSEDAKVRRAKAELEFRQLLKRQELERQEQELKRKRELLHLENEIEQAEMEENILDSQHSGSDRDFGSVRGSIGHISSDKTGSYISPQLKLSAVVGHAIPNRYNVPPSIPVPKEQPPTNQVRTIEEQNGRQQQRPSGRVDVGETTVNLNPEAPEWVELSDQPNNPRSGGLNESQQLQYILQQQQQQQKEILQRQHEMIQQQLQHQQETMLLMASTIRKGFELPRPVLLTFDGDPLCYHKFIKNFEANLAREASEDRMRLVYLVQQCTGEAKRAIDFCVNITPPEQGYAKAREILLKRYGQSHLISDAFIRQVVEGTRIKDADGDALMKLATDLQNCEITLTQIGCEADLNALKHIEAIVNRLPKYLQHKWVEVAAKVTESDGREPRFSHLVHFIDKKATAASSRFGRLASAKPERDNDPRNKWKPKQTNQSPLNKATTLVTRSTDHFNSGPRDSFKQRNKETRLEKCLFCDGSSHELQKCWKFREKNLQERKEFVRKEYLCILCMQKGHFIKRCWRNDTCKVASCGKRHHELLHPEITPAKNKNPHVSSEENAAANVPDITSEQANATNNGQCGATGAGKSPVSLRIIPVIVKGKDQHREVETYALLDDGSDISLCTSSLVKRLGLTGTPKKFSLTTVNGKSHENMGHEVQLIVKGLKTDEHIEMQRVWTVDQLPVSKRSIPSTEDLARWDYLQGIEIHKLEEQGVTIIIGCDVPEAHWVLEQRRGKRKQPYAVRTLLGWTLMGPTGTLRDSECQANFIKYEDELLHLQVEKMYQMDFSESTSSTKAIMSIEDKKALGIMESSAKQVNGHYQLALPWRYSPPHLPNNRIVAEMRLKQLKNRLQREPRLCVKYRETITDYITKGYAERVPEDQHEEMNGKCWYLPHHPVFHPQKPDKVRVVFDCASKYHGTSLNNQLLQGPDQTNSLIGVLLRFRQEPIALMADVEAMFHQVRVAPEDCNALRFLWWPEGDMTRSPQDHRMLVHLFGATSSPSCANYSLRKTAQDHGGTFDTETINTVNRNFYVDDCLKSVETVKKATRLAEQLSNLLSKGGFHLTKWVSNNRAVLAAISENERAPSVVDLCLGDLPMQRALGVHWDVEADVFGFRTIDRKAVSTRRGILSLVSSMYDPLGFVAPFVLPAKQMLQQLCAQTYEWDEEIPLENLKNLNDWLEGLPMLQDVTVPRCLRHPNLGEIRSVQLHHFSDASNAGYGAVSYLRLVDTSGNIHCSFLMGKSRVSPLKPVKTPRLELTAAVVAVKLDRQIQEELELQIQEANFWTDSTVVLQYINNEARRFQTFVANRLAVIHDSSKPSQWRFVDTKSNPADHASRGLSTRDQRKIKHWLEGPKFLWENESYWPIRPDGLKELPHEQLEWRKGAQEPNKEASVDDAACRACLSEQQKEEPLDSMFKRYSSWYSLQKGVAWLLRYLRYFKYHHPKESMKLTGVSTTTNGECIQGPLRVEEIRAATNRIVRYIQRQSFPKELEALKAASPDVCSKKSLELVSCGKESVRHTPIGRQTSGRRLSKTVGRTSVLRKLNPILVDGVVRVGGRLERAPISFYRYVKHPVILPPKHHVTDLVIRYYHQHEGHAGARHVLTAIQQKFWIIKGQAEVRRVVGRCIDCRKRKARPGEQIMAPLPAARVSPSGSPFLSVGVDYFGPLLVKQGRSRVKRYGCIFTCMAMRAVHIEISHSLDTESFLGAFTRFTSRRGQPKEVYSDNGTNFKGADAVLRNEFTKLSTTKAQEQIQDRLRQNYIQWHFNPPLASHTGGVWERMIRSVRQILRALLGEQLVDDETLLTFMAEVERILNDRPLTRQNNDPNDLEPLTPSKLLLLRPNPSVPPGIFVGADKYSKCWRQAQCLANAFWKRWIREYLPTLQERQKWLKPRRNLELGDLVLVVDSNVPRGQWAMGRIVEVYPDIESTVRQVMVRTATTRLRRDVRKLCL